MQELPGATDATGHDGTREHVTMPFAVTRKDLFGLGLLALLGRASAQIETGTRNTETLAFIETSGFLGFQVADITTGRILYSVSVNGFTYSGPNYFVPSHGISLSPEEKELYISDWPHSHAHVFDVSDLPRKAPTKVADIKLHAMDGSESPCISTNCMREGWVLHSRDGRFVYIGDAGDVIDTATRKSVAYLAPLANTRKFLEIDWANGRPVFATSRYGVGYVTKQH